MDKPIVNILTRPNSDSDDWKPVFSTNLGVSVEYATQYVELNHELGWTKYRFLY